MPGAPNSSKKAFSHQTTLAFELSGSWAGAEKDPPTALLLVHCDSCDYSTRHPQFTADAVTITTGPKHTLLPSAIRDSREEPNRDA